MNDKEDRKVAYVEEKRFGILTKESIRLIAESSGYSELSDDVAVMLGEDVSYRLREAVQNSAQYMKHARRRKMTVDDFNKALKVSDVQPIHGYRSPESVSFKQTKEGDIFFVEDSEVNFANIAFNSNVPKNQGDASIKAHWLAVEGISKITSSSSQGQTRPGAKREDLQMYFDNVTNAILGCDSEAMKIALNDLKTNPHIVPLLPRFVNFVYNGVKTVSHDIAQLMKLLHTVKSLVNNSSIYLEPQSYLSLLVQAVTYCLLESLAASVNPINDHWKVRDYAAVLLAQIVVCWSSPVNHLMYNTVKVLKEALHDLTKPFCCHYGAVVGLTALGYKAIEDVLIPHLPTYWPHITSVLDDVSYSNAVAKTDAHKVYGAMLIAVEFLMRKHISDFEKSVESEKMVKTDSEEFAETKKDIKQETRTESHTPVSGDPVLSLPSSLHKTNVKQFYCDMYEYFGDSLCTQLPDLCEKLDLKNKVFIPKKEEKLLSLKDPEASKSGEDLLEEFMEQVRIQEQLDKERMERERIEFERLEAIRKKQEEEDRIKRIEIERLEEQLQKEKMRLIEIKMAELAQQRQQLAGKKRKRFSSNVDDDSESGDEKSVKAGEMILRQRTEVKYAEDSDSDIEERPPARAAAAALQQQAQMAVSATVSDPNKGIKMKIVKSDGLKIQIKTQEVKSGRIPAYATPPHTHFHKDPNYGKDMKQARPPAYSTPPHTHRDVKDLKQTKSVSHSTPPHHSTPPYQTKDTKYHSHQHHSKKRKQTLKPAASTSFDAYEFIESDPEDVKQLPFKQNYYSSDGGESSDGAGHRKPLTLKLKVKDSKEFKSD